MNTPDDSEKTEKPSISMFVSQVGIGSPDEKPDLSLKATVMPAEVTRKVAEELKAAMAEAVNDGTVQEKDGFSVIPTDAIEEILEKVSPETRSASGLSELALPSKPNNGVSLGSTDKSRKAWDRIFNKNAKPEEN